jgi:hypothetical protein
LLLHSYSLDFTVQADLIFPRNDTIYRPVYPFPIILALSNFSRAWKYMPTAGWELTKYEPSTRSTYMANSELAGFNWNGTQPKWGADPDKYLSVHWSEAPSRYNESYWRLKWSFWVGKGGCLEGPDQNSHGTMGHIFFRTSNDFGIMPNLTDLGPCPFTLGVVGITGQNQTDETCPLVSTPRPASTCGFTVDKPMADQVAKTMVDVSMCKNVTWPGGAGIGYQCSQIVDTTSEGSRLERNFFALMVSLVTLGLLSKLEWI